MIREPASSLYMICALIPTGSSRGVLFFCLVITNYITYYLFLRSRDHVYEPTGRLVLLTFVGMHQIRSLSSRPQSLTANPLYDS